MSKNTGDNSEKSLERNEKKAEIAEDPEIEKIKIDLRKYPSKPRVGIGAVITYEKKLLLILRKYEPDANKWSIPGGHLELGEKCSECAEREVFEETGIKVKAMGIAGVIDKIIYDEDNKIEWHYALINYTTKIIDESFKDGIPPLKANSDALDVKFVPFKNIKEFDITDSLKELLLEIGILGK
ncbi:MAG: NUDIX hydrolase [archaeon]|nr:NUDIX hydrolase [archaeon]